MARYRTSVPHSLGRREALARLQAQSDRMQRLARGTGRWSDDTLAFALELQGVRMQGTLRVEESSLEFDANLPLIALPFGPWVDRFLKLALIRGVPEHPTTALSAGEPAGADEAASPVVAFLHIPKAGGITLSEYIFNHVRIEQNGDDGAVKEGVLLLPYGFFKEPGLAVPDHIPELLRAPGLRAVLGHFWFGLHEHVNRPWRYVTLLRNPVDRILSLYHFLQLADRMTLKEFVSSPPFKEVDNDQTRRIAGVEPEIGACTAADLRTAQNNLREHFAVVGVTERFDETLLLLKRRFGWTREVLSYPKNVSEGRTRTSSLPPRVIEAIRERNQLDLELHAYATQLLEEAIAAEGADFHDELERYRNLRYASL